MKFFGLNNLDTVSKFENEGKIYHYFSLTKAGQKLNLDIEKLPFSLRILLENLLRFEGKNVSSRDLSAFANWLENKSSNHEIAYTPARVLMQDFTGVPAVVDLAAMRDAVKMLGGDANKINPLAPVDLVIDHSLQVDSYASKEAFEQNVKLEMERNKERYEFLRWGQDAFDNFSVVPPGTGICHQVNLEYLARVVFTRNDDGELFAFPDTLVGTDSHTTMVNGLGVLGWGVGGIEAEAVMLGQAMSMIIPEVIGVKIIGKMKEGATATDLVLTITQILRQKGVVNKFVEFFGSGIKNLSLANRATIANMAPEYGATCGFFPVDEETLNYLRLTAKIEANIELVKEYCELQKLWRDEQTPDPIFTDVVEVDLNNIEPSIAGPKRPQDKITLSMAYEKFTQDLPNLAGKKVATKREYQVNGADYKLANGDIVIAAITSCTNTSNPYVMVAAGLVAKKAVEKGINVKPWVKTSLAPGSKVVSEYLNKSGLQNYLDKIGFDIVGYGCTTCIGNSGPLKPEIEYSISENNLVVASILSGNRNFEGRVHPLTKANYLASPPLVVAYAITGTMNIDITKDIIALNSDGEPVYLKDIWPSNEEIETIVNKNLNASIFAEKYKDVFSGDKSWQEINFPKDQLYKWNKDSTYIQNPPYFEGMVKREGDIKDITNAYILAKFGDSITTDHISPAGSIAKNSPAAEYLNSKNVEIKDYNSYGSRRGNHEVMMRGTFANIRIKNELVAGTEGGFTKFAPTSEILSIYDAAMKYKELGKNLVVLAGKEYGTGSSRDWAAKGTLLLGVKAVIAESFERIHRSNLVRMGVIPLVFKDGLTRNDLNIIGQETITIKGLHNYMAPQAEVKCIITYPGGRQKEITLITRIDTSDEIKYIQHGGILQYVIRQILG